MKSTPKVTHCAHQFACRFVDRATEDAFRRAGELVKRELSRLGLLSSCERAGLDLEELLTLEAKRSG